MCTPEVNQSGEESVVDSDLDLHGIAEAGSSDCIQRDEWAVKF